MSSREPHYPDQASRPLSQDLPGTTPYSSLQKSNVDPRYRFFAYIRRAAVSASFPLRGIWYFGRNPPLYPLFFGRLLPLSLISFLVYFVLFAFAFLPQYAFLVIFHGWGAWVNALFLVLGEGLVIIQGLFEGFFVDECRVDVFDATLVHHNLSALISPHRILHLNAANHVKQLGKPTTTPAVYQPWSLVQIAELIVFLPLNLIPYVGTLAFILITGSRLGRLSHHRWFDLKGFTKAQRKTAIQIRSWEYVWFGTVAMLLELVPILSFFFLLTTAAGAALWVVKIEEEQKLPERENFSDENPVVVPSPLYSDGNDVA